MPALCKFSYAFFFLFFLLPVTVVRNLSAQERGINQDEEKVPAYTLPDPLQGANGKRVTDRAAWMRQRKVWLQLFADEVYGRMPGRPRNMHYQTTAVDSFALGGKAILKQVTIYFTRALPAPALHVLLFLPKAASGPAPIFVGLNFYGNQTVHSDTSIHITTHWTFTNEQKGLQNNRATESSRGKDAGKWQVETIIDRGFGLATAYYGDLEPDHPEGWKAGIRNSPGAELSIAANEWGAISAWAWGLSRMMDYLETEPAADAKKVIITGHSRLGKACLWAAANDERFAVIVSNNSGEGGAALSKRWFGETIERINTSFPHWFVPAYRKYNKNPGRLPVDQHILLALMAPRPLYIASASEDQWADPRGEFLSAKNAEPVYALFGKKGLGTRDMPGANSPVGKTIRYHLRDGKHDFTLYDWQQYLDFADKVFGRRSSK